MRSWSIEIYLVDDKGNDVQATCFEKAVYNLHPSFEKNKQRQSTSTLPRKARAGLGLTVRQRSRSRRSRLRRRDGESST